MENAVFLPVSDCIPRLHHDIGWVWRCWPAEYLGTHRLHHDGDVPCRELLLSASLR